MRTPLAAVATVLTALTAARAQTVTVAGQVFSREEKEPLASASISVVPQGTQLLASENGQFTLRNLSAGEIRLRFKRIGFVPKDTVLTLAGNDTTRIRIEMTRLAILLPAMVVNGKCT